jgi:phosphonate transport system substrate-binding protein
MAARKNRKKEVTQVKSTIRSTTLALLLCMLGAAPLSGGERAIMIGLVPDGLSQPERIPLQDYLSKQMGRDIELVTPNSYSEMMEGLSKGSIDFACLGALTYVRSRAKMGVVPLVQRPTDLQFRALFIAGAGTPIHSLKDLKGKKFSFGDINSTSGHVIPYLELKQAGLNPGADFEVRYSGGHPMTVKLVESGIVDAGVVDETVFSAMVGSGKIDSKKVRVFFTSRTFVDYVWVARRGLSEAEREKFVSAFLNLKEGRDDDVLKILRASKFIKANDDEYASVRQVARELKMF